VNANSCRIFLTDLFAGVLDLIYPPRCLLCELLGREILCDECLRSLITSVEAPYCLRCGQSQPGIECAKCVDFPAGLIRCRAVGQHEGELATLIHKLKYRNCPMLAKPLASLMSDFLAVRAEIMYNLEFDAVIPVPLHWSRLNSRGYNQSELLAKHLCAELGLTIELKVLTRVRRTKPQVGKRRQERLSNLKRAFSADQKRCDGRSFLLVDDVSTTGAALLSAGAKEVFAIALASG
jgi:competence protein ComFC